MVFDITQLKKIRKQLNLTQHKFAREAGVSQSMIAKIESGRLDPTYSQVRKIERAVEEFQREEGEKACEIMNRKVKTIDIKDKVKKVVSLMVKHNISQVPVVKRGKIVGLVSESDLLELEDATEKNVGEMMKESPPIVSRSARMEVVVSLLKFYPIVLVKDDGKLEGIITKADVLKRL